MSDRHKPHFGRDRDGDRKGEPLDLEDGLDTAERAAREIHHAGAVEDMSTSAAEPAKDVERLVEENREVVDKMRQYNRGL